MQLFLIAFSQPIPFGISAIVVGLMIVIMLRSAMVAEGGSTWVKKITNPNAKFLFAFLFIGWAVVFGIGLQLVPAHRRELAVRRHRAHRPVHRVLHHDGLPLGRDRRIAGDHPSVVVVGAGALGLRPRGT